MYLKTCRDITKETGNISELLVLRQEGLRFKIAR